MCLRCFIYVPCIYLLQCAHNFIVFRTMTTNFHMSKQYAEIWTRDVWRRGDDSCGSFMLRVHLNMHRRLTSTSVLKNIFENCWVIFSATVLWTVPCTRLHVESCGSSKEKYEGFHFESLKDPENIFFIRTKLVWFSSKFTTVSCIFRCFHLFQISTGLLEKMLLCTDQDLATSESKPHQSNRIKPHQHIPDQED